MIGVIRQKVQEIKTSHKADPRFIDTAVDFIRMYADQTHHGKEEDILFRDCAGKKLSESDQNIMNDLIDEHKYGRKIIAELMEAKENYVKGHDTLNIIMEKLTDLTCFYPKHIEKEDKLFFPDSEKYFSGDELESMLEEFRRFDQAMIHEKYKQVLEQFQ